MSYLPDRDDDDQAREPPSVERVKKRLMILWGSSFRAEAERHFTNEAEGVTEAVFELREWLFGELDDEVTQRERDAHMLPAGAWSNKQIIDASWMIEAAVPLGWALGLIRDFPKWDRERTTAGCRFIDFPQPSTWKPELTLRAPRTIELQAMSVEAHYWRIRVFDRSEEAVAYAKKLMGRAARLGQVKLAADGDLALSDGRSIAELAE